MYNIDSKDYILVENPASEFYSVKLKCKEWHGIIFTYGAVSVKEDKANDTATLSFNWQLQDAGNFEPEEINTSEKFQNYIGALLQHIITESLTEKEAKIGTANTHIKSSDT